MRFFGVISLIALPLALALPVPSIESMESFHPLPEKDPASPLGVSTEDLCSDGSLRAYDPDSCVPYTNFP